MLTWRSLYSAANWHFDIDAHLNPIVPPSILRHLPFPIAHFLGHRTSARPRRLGNLIVILWAFLGVFCGVSVVTVVGSRIPAIRGSKDGTSPDATPIIIASFGAAAVLEFYAIESPLAQPRNSVIGQVLASVIGVGVAQLMALAGPSRFAELRWLGGSLACATATAAMALTGTVHPPAGATALLAVTDGDAHAIGWWLVPAVLVGSVLMQCIALVFNNVQQRYPMYWWSREETGQVWRRGRRGAVEPREEDAAQLKATSNESSATANLAVPSRADTDVESGTGTVTFARTDTSRTPAAGDGVRTGQVVITRHAVVVPDYMYLRAEEKLILETLCERL